MSTWLIRLNGAPFCELTAPSWMNPTQATRRFLAGETDENVSVRWVLAA
jgi:hypothetical protein